MIPQLVLFPVLTLYVITCQGGTDHRKAGSMTSGTQQQSATRSLIRAEGLDDSAPYSSAAVVGDIVWTAGALPKTADGSVPADFRDQIRVALFNLETSLNAAGADWGTVVKINGYVSDITALPELNEVYKEIIGSHGLPPRTAVEVSRFRGDVAVEFDAVAVRRNGGDA